MTGQAFLDTLSAQIAPATLSQQDIRAGTMFILITLPDKKITVTRKRIKDCANQAELDAYVMELLA